MLGIATYFNILIIILAVLVWLIAIGFLRLRKKKSIVYVALFTIFYIYLVKVLDYTLFQYQSLLLLKHVMPSLMLNGVATNESVNIIPLITLTLADAKTSLLNILLFVPFGLGLPLIADMSMKKIVTIGACVSIAIELLQFLTGYLSGITFRIADINDLLFNTLGVVIGYALFLLFKILIKRNILNL